MQSFRTGHHDRQSPAPPEITEVGQPADLLPRGGEHSGEARPPGTDGRLDRRRPHGPERQGHQPKRRRLALLRAGRPREQRGPIFTPGAEHAEGQLMVAPTSCRGLLRLCRHPCLHRRVLRVADCLLSVWMNNNLTLTQRQGESETPPRTAYPGPDTIYRPSWPSLGITPTPDNKILRYRPPGRRRLERFRPCEMRKICRGKRGSGK